jgi:cytochrome c-type biogenesis protein CcmH/NrfG
MPADLYATEVNRQVSAQEADKYFAQVRKGAEAEGFLVRPWSQIRKENEKAYRERSSELTEDAIVSLLTPQKLTEAERAARKRSGYIDRNSIHLAALAYLRERICEAEIIEKTYQPIKVSAVAKNKDNGVDRALPRVYILPDEYQFPWIK